MKELRKNLEEFLPFFEDLRRRLYRGVILFVIFFVVGLLSTSVILGKIVSFVHFDQVTFATFSPFQFAEVAIDIGFFVAIMAFTPYIIYSFYIFMVPALTRRERKQLLKSVPLSIGLFIIGFSYGFFILYYALELLAAINTNLGIANFWNIGQFLSQILITSALLGLVFQFPLLLTLLIKIGVMTTETLRNSRRVAYAIMLSCIALLPPTDGISLIAMTVPLALLYEVTILLNKSQKHVWIGT